MCWRRTHRVPITVTLICKRHVLIGWDACLIAMKTNLGSHHASQLLARVQVIYLDTCDWKMCKVPSYWGGYYMAHENMPTANPYRQSSFACNFTNYILINKPPMAWDWGCHFELESLRNQVWLRKTSETKLLGYNH